MTSTPYETDLSFYAGKTVLVTGASGFLATNLVHALLHVDCRIVRLSRGRALPPLMGSASVVDVHDDLREPIAWQRAVAEVDAIFHFAGQTSVYVAEDDPLADIGANVVPIVNMLEACRKSGHAPTIVFAGSATEVGLTQGRSPAAGNEDRPVTIYDAHKLMAENYLKMYSRSGVVRGTTLRLTNVYGPGPANGSADRGVINMMMRRALAGDSLTVYGKGDCVRDYIYVSDAVAAFLVAPMNVERVNGKHFVVGSGDGHTIAEAFELIADRVARQTGNRVVVRYVDPPDGQSEIDRRDFVADTSPFGEATGWRANHRLADGIDQTVSTLRQPEEAPAKPSRGPLRDQIMAGATDGIRLNIGCGGRPLPGYVNIDHDNLTTLRARYPDRTFPEGIEIVQADVFDLPYADGEIAEVRAESFIEHLNFIEEPRFFHEVRRVLRPGGIFRFSTPDFEKVVRLWLAAKDEWKDFYRSDDEAIAQQHWFGHYSYDTDNRWGYLCAIIFGNQNGEGQFHRNCYTVAKIRAILEHLNFEEVEISHSRWKGDRDPMIDVLAAKPAG